MAKTGRQIALKLIRRMEDDKMYILIIRGIPSMTGAPLLGHVWKRLFGVNAQ